MKRDNIIQEKSYNYSLRIIQPNQLIIKEYVLAKQILKSGTSVGANIEEAFALNPGKTLKLNSRYRIRKVGKQNTGFG